MNITHITPGQQLYTLLATDNETKQKIIISYNSSAILTTELDELVIHTARLIHHYGKAFTYTISMVQEMHITKTNELMIAALNRLESGSTEDKITVSAYAGAKVKISK